MKREMESDIYTNLIHLFCTATGNAIPPFREYRQKSDYIQTPKPCSLHLCLHPFMSNFIFPPLLNLFRCKFLQKEHLKQDMVLSEPCASKTEWIPKMTGSTIVVFCIQYQPKDFQLQPSQKKKQTKQIKLDVSYKQYSTDTLFLYWKCNAMTSPTNSDTTVSTCKQQCFQWYSSAVQVWTWPSEW